MRSVGRLWGGCALVMAAASLAGAATFTWTGGRCCDRDECDNWTYTGLPATCYPSTSSDDVTIPSIYGGWTIDLVDIELLDDVTILDSVDFG
ncbi:hypothetical protein RAS1_43630 [Phycisphaerae bacterium RAS1]|nr:hypothetical protein RAS1_43630 [Phycisphaerae bacterium RAS1]